MDSITQAALGAAVGEAVLGPGIGGRKALLWGAVLGTLPDLDVLIQYTDPVASFTSHRGFSHSWLVYLLVSPLLAWALKRLHAEAGVTLLRWTLFVFLCLFTHALLDACTIYGTQLFWPFGFPPVGWGFIFIIDPLYTLPLLIGVFAAIFWKENRSSAHVINNVALVVSSIYLLGAFGVKEAVAARVERQLADRHIPTQKILVTPMPFNILLWRILSLDHNGYYEGVVSVFDRGGIVLQHHRNDYSLITDLQEHWPARRLNWFTHGFYSIQQQGDDIVMSDIRLGAQGRYPFSFRIAKTNQNGIEPVASEYSGSSSYDVEDLRWIFRRITDETLDAPPPNSKGLSRPNLKP